MAMQIQELLNLTEKIDNVMDKLSTVEADKADRANEIQTQPFKLGVK